MKPPEKDALTRRAMIAEAAEILRKADVHQAERDAKHLLIAAEDLDPIALISDPEALVQQESLVRDYIQRRAQREPVARILGRRGFWQDDFIITKDVLDPRPDTETLVETALEAGLEYVDQKALERREPLSLLDLGTGSGCILLSLLFELPEAQGIGVDLSEEALGVATQNAQRTGLTNRATFQPGSWWSPFAEKVGPLFDLVVSNPPYIPSADIDGLAPEVQDYDPRLALDGGIDGLICYRAILEKAKLYIRPQGSLIFELGIGQDASVIELAEQHGLVVSALREDLNAVPRVLWLKIPE